MTHEINNSSFSPTHEAAASFHDDGIVILHTGKGRLFSSNRTGAQIWRGIEQQLPVEMIVQQLSGEYQIALNTAREHTFDFLVQLQRNELVQREARQ